MRRLRFLLFAVVLLAVASPMFAFCQYCGADSICRFDSGVDTFCIQGYDYCYEEGGCNSGVGALSPTSELVVAVVEVTRPDGTNDIVIDHTVRVAQAKPATDVKAK